MTHGRKHALFGHGRRCGGAAVCGQHASPSVEQPVLVSANVAEVKKGYRAAWLLGDNVLNEQSERFGTIVEFAIGQDYALFAVLEAGGFLGVGGHMVAVPIRALVFEDGGHKVVLREATRKALRNFPEFRFPI
jgi:hypothetical protein